MEILLSLIIQLSIAFGYGGDVDFDNMSQEQKIEFVRDIDEALIEE